MCNGKTGIDVILLSAEDGRRSLVHTARKLSSSVTNHQFKCTDIVPSNVDAILQGKEIIMQHKNVRVRSEKIPDILPKPLTRV